MLFLTDFITDPFHEDITPFHSNQACSPQTWRLAPRERAFTHSLYLGNFDCWFISDPQPDMAWNLFQAAICVQNVGVHVSCSSHVCTQLAAFFIDPRAEWSTTRGWYFNFYFYFLYVQFSIFMVARLTSQFYSITHLHSWQELLLGGSNTRTFTASFGIACELRQQQHFSSRSTSTVPQKSTTFFHVAHQWWLHATASHTFKL